MNDLERMISGKVYFANALEVSEKYKYAKDMIRSYNLTTDQEESKRIEIIKKLFGKVGENFHIEPPFRCDYGFNIEVGDNFYANYDCIFLDVCKVKIGNNVFLGPRVSVFTAAHPTASNIRNIGLEFGKEIKIGNNVWIGGNTVINPGVKIGDNTVIGSGSVVTKDIPSDVIAAGNPCKIIRNISSEDNMYWEKVYKEYIQTSN